MAILLTQLFTPNQKSDFMPAYRALSDNKTSGYLMHQYFGCDDESSIISTKYFNYLINTI